MKGLIENNLLSCLFVFPTTAMSHIGRSADSNGNSLESILLGWQSNLAHVETRLESLSSQTPILTQYWPRRDIIPIPRVIIHVLITLKPLVPHQAKKKFLCCPLPTDRKMRKKQGRVFFFFFFFLCQIWAKNLLKFVFNGLKKRLYICVLTAFRPSFPPFRNFKKYWKTQLSHGT